ncbi:carboxypeptidase-like regulatory domain-containing protein [Hymenobacter tenuis]
MDANTTTPIEDQDQAAQELISEEEELSSGNSRLALIVGAILALVILGYVLLPAQTTRRIANAMPIMELGEATVTGTRIKEEAPKEAAADQEEDEDKTTQDDKEKLSAAAKAAAAKAAAAKSPTGGPAAPANEQQEAVAAPVAVEAVPEAPAAVEAAPANVTVSGRILDENGRPLAGATVMLKGSRKATGTDANGNYSLELPAGDNTLVYGYGGYEDQELRTRNVHTQNVTLVPREGAKRRRR